MGPRRSNGSPIRGGNCDNDGLSRYGLWANAFSPLP